MRAQVRLFNFGKRFALAGGLALFTVHLAARAQGVTNAPEEILLVEAQGTVEVSPAGAITWVKTQSNQVLHVSDRLRTSAASRATLRWSDQSVMQLGPLTELEILPHAASEEPGLHLWQGILSFFHRDKPGRIRILTRGVTAGIQGTEFVLAETGEQAPEQTTLSVIDGQVRLTNAVAAVTLTNGDQVVSLPGRAPTLRRGFIANNILQWCFYYPAVLDLRDLPLSEAERAPLESSMAAYQSGDVVTALEKYPGTFAGETDNARVYHAAVLLAVGEAGEAERIIGRFSGGPSERARRLGDALRWLIAAVKRQTAPVRKPELPTEFLAASYYAQSQGRGDESLTNALQLAETAAYLSPQFSFALERVAELEFGFGRASAARAALAKSLTLAPRNAQAVSLNGFLFSAQNRMRAAEAEFDLAISLDSALGNAWLGRGLCRIKRGRTGAGLDDLLVAAALEPQRALLRSYLGKAFANRGDDAHASKELALARALDPSDPTAWLYSALLKQQENQINQAVSDLEKAQDENDNRSLFRSRLLLDQDRGVAGANLAAIYRDAGLTDVAVREAAKAVADDYANSSAHLFLSDSYYNLLDPTQFNLRYDTAWFNELLLANILAPVGAGRLSQQVSQQDYSKLFESDGLGFAASVDSRTDGMYHETASQFGTYGNTSYALDLDDQHNTGWRVNNGLDDLNLDVTIKQQITPHDTAMLLVQDENYHSGDNFQYYYQTNARPFYKFNEDQQPELVGTWHHEWAPGIHTILLLDRLVDHQTFTDEAVPQFLFVQSPRGAVTGAVSVPFDVNYTEDFTVYGAELNQICQWDRVTWLGGLRYQSGTFQTQDQLNNPSVDPSLFTKSAGSMTYGNNINSLFQRATAYSYLTVKPAEHLSLTGGVAADEVTFPYYFRSPPVSSGEDTRSQLGPKAALVWEPTPELTFRGIYTRSLGGVSIDESYRLEPTQLAGFPQAFRSLISESVVGSQSAPTLDTLAGAMDLKLGSRTYLGLQVERLGSHVDEGQGDFVLQNGGIPAVASDTPEEFNYTEHTGSVTLNQLVANDFAMGAGYSMTESALHAIYPDIPLSALPTANETLTAHLQQVNTYFQFNHPCGFYARFEVNWYGQHNAGWTPAEPNVSFFQENIYAGYFFAHRRGQIELGILNLGGGGYDLNPLTVYQELPMKRVFEAKLNVIF